MNRVQISLQDFEEAERQLLLTQRMHRWRVHAVIYAVVGTLLVLLNVRSGGSWLPDGLVLGVWAGFLFGHYRWAREYGDVHVREQQIRAEWNAGRSKEGLAHK